MEPEFEQLEIFGIIQRHSGPGLTWPGSLGVTLDVDAKSLSERPVAISGLTHDSRRVRRYLDVEGQQMLFQKAGAESTITGVSVVGETPCSPCILYTISR